MEEKTALRIKVSALVSQMDEGEKALQSELCVSTVLGMEQYSSADMVLGYMALGSEVNVEPVLEAAIRAGKTVALPRVVPGTGRMVFYRMESGVPLGRQLAPGGWGIMEPVPDEGRLLVHGDFFLHRIFAIVPGVAFSSGGARLGHGKGFYDKFFASLYGGAQKPQFLFKAGVCYACQCVQKIPLTACDVQMDAVIAAGKLFL